jgi:hypothetical protein
MKIYIIILFTFFFHNLGFSTIQIPDKIKIGGKIYCLETFPFDIYLKNHKTKIPFDKISSNSTALRRGYIATYEIKNNLIFLVDIEIEIENNSNRSADEYKSVFSKIFKSKKPILIDWYSGLISIQMNLWDNYLRGENLKFTIIEISNGNILKQKTFDEQQYEEFLTQQFIEFKKTPEYKALKEKSIKEYESVEEFDMVKRTLILKYTTKILYEW